METVAFWIGVVVIKAAMVLGVLFAMAVVLELVDCYESRECHRLAGPGRWRLRLVLPLPLGWRLVLVRPPVNGPMVVKENRDA